MGIPHDKKLDVRADLLPNWPNLFEPLIVLPQFQNTVLPHITNVVDTLSSICLPTLTIQPY